MNPKTFMDLYDDGLQAEEIESEKKKNTRSEKKLSNWGHAIGKY